MLNKRFSVFGLLALSSTQAFAFEGGSGRSLSDIVSTVMVGGDVLTKLIWAACIIVGLALIAAAFTQFQIHRRNPKLVPLATPVLYLILGIVAIAIPFVGQNAGFLAPAVQSIKGAPKAPTSATRQQQYDPNDIDAPLY